VSVQAEITNDTDTEIWKCIQTLPWTASCTAFCH